MLLEPRLILELALLGITTGFLAGLLGIGGGMMMVPFITIILDNKGNLWFGTTGGVSRYDGTIWQTFTTKDGLANNDVRAVTQDSKGNLWFGTYGGGISRYEPG